MNLSIVAWFLFLLPYVKAWTCVSPISKVYSRVNTDAVLQFNSDLTNLNSPRQFDVKFYNGTIKARITYNADKSSSVQTAQGVSATADTGGNVVVTLNNVQEDNAGIYILTSSGFSTKCNSLYILGTPVKPTVTVNKTPSVGESVQLTCSSTSTTTPSNHSLSLKYDWKVNNNEITDGTKYTSNANKLTVNNIAQEDVNKQFTCTATEDVTDGYTSPSSDQFSFDVYYGPDSLQFTPSDTSYEKVENDNLNQVTCTATCYPVCSFTWTKTESSTQVSSTAILSLGRLQSSEAGTYRCTATRTGGYTKSKELTVNVIYGPKNIFFNPSTVSYRRDENSKLAQVTCGADCWECSYSWTGPNSYTSSNAVLDLNPLTKTMAGAYTCTARNIKRSQLPPQSKQLTIEVRYGPDSIKLTNGQTEYTVDENTQLSDIKCEADCFPECTYTWTKDGQSVSNTDTLSLGQVQKSAAGNYICRATNGDTPSKWKEKTVTIHIRYGPYISSTQLIPSTKTYTMNEEQKINNINCSADCYPACVYTWSKTRHGQTVTVSNVSGVLSLGNLHRDDAALYTCSVKNPGKISSPETTKQTEVHVRYGPDSAHINKKSPHTVTEGDANVRIECSADCYPGCSYNWRNISNSSMIIRGGIFHLDTVVRENAGDYKCIVINSATSAYSKSAESTIKLTVQYAPDVSINLSKTVVKEGEDLALNCIGHGVPIDYNHTSLTQSWNNINIPNNNTAVSGTDKWSSLYFKSLRLDDTGTYTCTLNNGITNRLGILDQSASKDIMVQVAPKVLRNDLRFTGSTSAAIRIEIPIYSNPKIDTPTITRYDGLSISKDSLTVTNATVETKFYGKPVTLQGSLISLVLNNTKEEDFGNYSLIMKNSLNTTQVLVHVIAEGPPLAPKLFLFHSENNIITFLWQKDFNGGLHQYFVIQTSVAGTDTWKSMFNVSEKDNHYKVNSTFYSVNVTGLSPGKYVARIYAHNEKGQSDIVDLETSFNVIKKTEPESSPVGIIAGVTSAVVLVILAVVVILIILKRRRSNKDGFKNKLNTRGRTGEDDDDDEDEVNTVNPMYVSADEVQVADNTYAQPIKKKKTPEVSDVYAMVDKKKKKDPKDNKKKKGKSEIEGDIYENAPPSALNENSKAKKGKAYDENLYENPSAMEAKKPKRNVNKDGLIYADLAFNAQPKGQKKLVIHGLDNMTEYVEVDFTKKADPLPDSDEEDNAKK